MGGQGKNIIHGHVDLDIIKQVKESVSIPVIGNGDIKTKEDAIKMFEYTNVDGIMIGRANLGKPWLIRELSNKLNEEPFEEISNLKRLEILKEHLELALKEKGEYIGIREMRKHICWYIKNLKDSSRAREQINKIENSNELIACLEEYFNNI